MKKYFRLNPFIIFRNSSNEGCLYNLVDGTMYKLTRDKVKIIQHMNDCHSIDNLDDTKIQFLNQLEGNGLGKYYTKPVYIDETYLGSPIEFERSMEKNIDIKRIYLEITNQCNLDCIFCNSLDDKAYKKTGCKRWSSTGKRLDIEQYKDIINQAILLGLKEIVFTGGEPFLEFDKIKEIIEFSYKAGVNKFIIYTNLVHLSTEIIDFIKTFNIELMIQLVSLKEDEFKVITNKTLNVNILNMLRILTENKINFITKILINKINEDSVEYMIKLLSDNGYNKILIDYIYPHNKVYHSPKYLPMMFDKKLKLVKVDLDQYTMNSKYNRCFYNQIAITLNGDIIPCIMLRKMKLGSILQKKLCKVVIDEKYFKMVTLTKEKINKCNKCSLNLGCVDCVAIQSEVTGSVYEIEYCK